MTALVTLEGFRSGDTDCAGTLYLPPDSERPPVVVMGHGLGAQQDFRLPAFAERFVERGLASVLPGSKLREYECNHFEPYYDPWFETFVTEQADFLVEKLQ